MLTAWLLLKQFNHVFSRFALESICNEAFSTDLNLFSIHTIIFEAVIQVSLVRARLVNMVWSQKRVSYFNFIKHLVAD